MSYKGVLYKCEEHKKKYKSITYLDVDEILNESNIKDQKMCLLFIVILILLAFAITGL